MRLPSLKELDYVRKKGLRPQIVACLIHKGRLLMVYAKKHELWQIPQGGIDNRETLGEAFAREMTEELGETFARRTSKEYAVFAESKVMFPESTRNSRKLTTDNGKEVFMNGKKYFFITSVALSNKLNIRETQFDDHRWATYAEGMKLASAIYQKGKQRITKMALDSLKKEHLIN